MSAFVVLVAALALASVLPAWSMAALPLVLAASELAPVVTVLALAGVPLVWWTLASRPRVRLAALAVLAVAAVLGLRPLASVALVARSASARLVALGARALPVPEALRGIESADCVRERSVAYHAADGSPLEMRLFDCAPRTAAARPIVVVLYGGAWRAGEPSQGARTSRALAAHGWLVAAIDYRHAPRAVFPAQLDDVRRSLALIRDSAATWQGDATRLALLGRSAGGHLAELAAYAPDAPPVRAVVAVYAPWDLVAGYRDVPVPDPIGVRGVIRQFVGGTPEERPGAYRAASPASSVRAGLPPTLLLYGANDHLVKARFNREAADALRRAGVPVVPVEIPWAEHGFDLVPGGLGERVAWAVEWRFLESLLGAAE